MLRKLGIVIILTFSAAPAWGQLTSADIDSLREEGKRQGWTFTVGENPATQRPLEQLCGMGPSPEWREQVTVDEQLTSFVLPPKFDWRELDGVTPIKDQAACGSCWAFATVAALECNIKIRDSVEVDLSEQYLVSCNPFGVGCWTGGFAAHGMHLTSDNPDCIYGLLGGYGPVLESCLPYEADDVPCVNCQHQIKYCLLDWGWMPIDAQTFLPTTERMKYHIMHNGPIWVCVEVTQAFQAYLGGVFNACEIMIGEPEGNHAAALVGWDDSQGDEGVFILRNSWGTGWGEDGYMKIGYGCNKLGSMGNYVDYGLPRTVFWSDTTWGRVPLDVNVGASSLDEVISWSWDFGDGHAAEGQTTGHTYTQRGVFDLSLEVEYTATTRTYTKPSYIYAIADTLTAADVSGPAGTPVEIMISANNTTPVKEIWIPVEFDGEMDLTFVSASRAGCRTEYFETCEYKSWEPHNGRFTFKLDAGSSPELEPGEGPLLKLICNIPPSSPAGQSTSITLDGYSTLTRIYLPRFVGSVAEYVIETESGVAVSSGCCQTRGDIDHGGSVDLGDVSYFIDWTFSDDSGAPCPVEADVDGNGEVNIEDLVYLVNYLYGSGTPPPVACQ